MSNIIKSKEDLQPLFKLRNLILDNHEKQADNFLGRVLTIIDASIADSEQRKGIKDLIKNEYYNAGYNTGWRYEARAILYSFVQKFAKESLPNEDDTKAYFGEMNPSNPQILDFFPEYN